MQTGRRMHVRAGVQTPITTSSDPSPFHTKARHNAHLVMVDLLGKPPKGILFGGGVCFLPACREGSLCVQGLGFELPSPLLSAHCHPHPSRGPDTCNTPDVPGYNLCSACRGTAYSLHDHVLRDGALYNRYNVTFTPSHNNVCPSLLPFLFMQSTILHLFS
jgi:hypothetical protein